MSQVVPIGMSDRRLPQAGRIRIGEKTKSRGGRTSIDTFKFTTSDVDLLKPLAERYGGTVGPWNEPSSGDKWQLRTKATKIHVVLPPDPLSQSYELWDPQLLRRCNGIICQRLIATADDAEFQEVDCICARKGELECTYKLRLNVLLADVESLGTWRLDTSSEHARKEMPAVVEAIERLQEHGFHKAVLRLEQRRSPRKVFNVPVLDPGVSIETLVSGDTRLGQLPVAPRPAPAGELGAAVEEGVPSPSSAATSLPGSDVHEPSSIRPLDDDDEVVDAEIVEEVDPMFARARLFDEQSVSAKVRNRRMRLAAQMAQEAGEPIPVNAAAIPDRIIQRLVAEADE